MISAKVIADSVNPDGQRITTLEGVFNRYLLAEFNTHRVFTRNSASSRAIPVKKIMSQVWNDPAMPLHWGANQAGMQAGAELTGWRRSLAERIFRWTRIPVLVMVWFLTKLKLHKQVANRLLEPWVWHTIVFTSTEFDNFFKLRLHPDAQPEFQAFAREVKEAMDGSVPIPLRWGDWHTPYVTRPDGRWDYITIAKVSAACCARVSYVRQNDRKSENEDVAFADRLSSSGHFSPLEHPAMALQGCRDSNFSGWQQLRKLYPGEDGVTRIVPCICHLTSYNECEATHV